MYANGMGVQQDNETALHFFKHAAEGGSSSGLFGLGYMHLTGHTTQQDYRKAFKLLQAASEMVGLSAMHVTRWCIAPDWP